LAGAPTRLAHASLPPEDSKEKEARKQTGVVPNHTLRPTQWARDLRASSQRPRDHTAVVRCKLRRSSVSCAHPAPMGAATKSSQSGRRTRDDGAISADATRKPSGRRAIRINMPAAPFRTTNASPAADPTDASIRPIGELQKGRPVLISTCQWPETAAGNVDRGGRTTPPKPFPRSTTTL